MIYTNSTVANFLSWRLLTQGLLGFCTCRERRAGDVVAGYGQK